jgi:hypothetical protein
LVDVAHLVDKIMDFAPRARVHGAMEECGVTRTLLPDNFGQVSAAHEGGRNVFPDIANSIPAALVPVSHKDSLSIIQLVSVHRMTKLQKFCPRFCRLIQHCDHEK